MGPRKSADPGDKAGLSTSQRAASAHSFLGFFKMTFVKMAVAWGLFIGMIFFYAMLPIASLQLLPFLFFGCISLLVGLWDEAGGYRR